MAQSKPIWTVHLYPYVESPPATQFKQCGYESSCRGSHAASVCEHAHVGVRNMNAGLDTLPFFLLWPHISSEVWLPDPDSGFIHPVLPQKPNHLVDKLYSCCFFNLQTPLFYFFIQFKRRPIEVTVSVHAGLFSLTTPLKKKQCSNLGLQTKSELFLHHLQYCIKSNSWQNVNIPKYVTIRSYRK